MYYVYCLASQSKPSRRYVGFTEELRQRLGTTIKVATHPPTVMMFVQSLHGISHNKIEDMERGAPRIVRASVDILAEKAMAWIQAQR